jgi:hypothetical protein
MRFARGLALITTLISSIAFADSHRGSLGLTVAAGFEPVSSVAVDGPGDRGFRVPLELGGTLGLFTHTSLRLAARVGAPLPSLSSWAFSFFGGVRNAFSIGQWVTFFDLELAVHATPLFAVGARAGFGVQYDVLPIMGVYALISGQLAGGYALRLSGDVMIGVQFRSYLFE